MGNGTIKRYALVGGSMSLCRQALKSYAQTQSYTEKTLLLVAHETVSLGCSQIKMQHHVYHTAMLPAMMIMD